MTPSLGHSVPKSEVLADVHRTVSVPRNLPSLTDLLIHIVPSHSVTKSLSVAVTTSLSHYVATSTIKSTHSHFIVTNYNG